MKVTLVYKPNMKRNEGEFLEASIKLLIVIINIRK